MSGNHIPDEPPRTTAYYYGDLERIKRGTFPRDPKESQQPEIVIKPESPRVRNALRKQQSLPEYKEETYSTAGTIPLPEVKEKEPLLAELEVVGSLPLTQLDGGSVSRSRSWYFCCPKNEDEDISRESSWRYSSLRPVTAPPISSQNNISLMQMVARTSEDPSVLRAERDALAQALQCERQRATAAAAAHDARLAELHGVIAELMRRRAVANSGTIPEESDRSEECESTTQPAGELDNDADRSRTDQNSSSVLSPEELPTPQEPAMTKPSDVVESKPEPKVLLVRETLQTKEPSEPRIVPECDNNMVGCDRCCAPSEYSGTCFNSSRCCHVERRKKHTNSSCSKERGSIDDIHPSYSISGRVESRHPKIASRVRLRRTGDDTHNTAITESNWSVQMAEKLAQDVCAQADIREALLSASLDTRVLCAGAVCARAHVSRLEADNALLEGALSNAIDTAQRLYMSCVTHECCYTSLCEALRASDRALEAYDVLLALAETLHPHDSQQRKSAELVAKRLLLRLESNCEPSPGQPLLPPGPWLQEQISQDESEITWDQEAESRLREHAANFKTQTVALRETQLPPKPFSYDDEEKILPTKREAVSVSDMEVAILMQEVASCREERASLLSLLYAERAKTEKLSAMLAQLESESGKRRERHWLDPAEPNQTDL